MWVLTEDVKLVHLATGAEIVAGDKSVDLYRPDYDEGRRPYVSLCKCDDEGHGKEIIARLAVRLQSGSRLVVMGDMTTAAEPLLARHQPCGCVVCYCEGMQCQGCGAKNCGNHASGELSDPVYVGE